MTTNTESKTLTGLQVAIANYKALQLLETQAKRVYNLDRLSPTNEIALSDAMRRAWDATSLLVDFGLMWLTEGDYSEEFSDTADSILANQNRIYQPKFATSFCEILTEQFS